MQILCFKAVIILTAIHLSRCGLSPSPKVTVKQGTVIGGKETLPNGSSYYFFKGIPYAVPPLGELRFKAPVPLDRFSTPEINCTKEGEVSFQDGFMGKNIGSEDCLFLNVYTPKIKCDKQFPVMVFIHGGGFTYGSGNSDFYNPLYLVQEEVVVVTINYRLGVLGFLSLPEANIPGNAGLKDQRLALQWVKENISKFNGNPNNVTLVGESAGAASAHFHVLSRNSKKLFQRAILQSGLGSIFWAIDDAASNKTMQMAKLLGSSSDDPFEVAKFLQNYQNLNDFIYTSPPGTQLEEVFNGRSFPILPVIEKDIADAVVTRAPLESMNDANSIEIPLMMGYNSAEGIIFLPLVRNIEEFNDLRKVIPRNINVTLDDRQRQDLADKAKEFYFKGKNVDNTTLSSFSDLLGDLNFIVDIHVAAEIHSRKQHKSPLFFYRFDYDGALNFYKNLIFQVKDVKGASHADELAYIFQATIAPEPWEARAKKMVQIMVKLWTNFAKYGNPTPKEERIVHCSWEPVRKTSNKEAFTLNAFIIDEHQRMLDNPNGERIAFWKKMGNKYNF